MHDVVAYTSYFFYLPGLEKSEEEERNVLVVERSDRIPFQSETGSVRVSGSASLALLLLVGLGLSKKNGEELIAVKGSMDPTHFIRRK